MNKLELNILFINNFKIRTIYEFTNGIIKGNLSVRLVDTTIPEVMYELNLHKINYSYNSNRLIIKFKLNNIKIDVAYANSNW